MSRDLQQHRDNSSDLQTGRDVDVDAEHDPEVSRRASNAGLRRQVQMKGGNGADAEQVQAAAQRGTAGPGRALPHADVIQRAFGAHDISDIRAHVGGGAQAATGAMGAEAYATGNQIAFAEHPDLHTAAHEAAHVVQQKQGVSLSGGVGQEGDAHEKQADAIADQVVAGKSVEHMLGAPSANAAPAAGQAVQKKESDKVVEPKSHENADYKSNFSAQSALKHLAVQLHAWEKPLSELASSQSVEGSGYEIAAQKIEEIFASAATQIEMARQAIIAVKPGDRHFLSRDVQAAQYAFNRFDMAPAPRAQNFLKDHGHTDNPDRLKLMEQTVNGFTDQIGYSAADLPLTDIKVDGDEKSLAKEMIDDQITGLSAALDSVKAGNEADVQRINIHARYLDNVGRDEPAQIKTHRAQIKKLSAELEQIRKDKPSLELGEAHGHLAKLTK